MNSSRLFQPPNDCTTNGHPHINIITPKDPEKRGSQLSLYFSSSVDVIHKELVKRGVCVSNNDDMYQ